MKLYINKQGITFDNLPIKEAFSEIDKWIVGDLYTNNPIIIQYVIKTKPDVAYLFNEVDITNDMNIVFSFYAEILKNIIYS